MHRVCRCWQVRRFWKIAGAVALRGISWDAMNAVITQSDVATAYGWGLDALWNGLMSGQTAIRSTQRFAERGFLSDQAAMIPDLSPEPGESRAMAAIRRILSPIAGKLDPMTPLILASTVGEIEYLERAILEGDSSLIAESRPQALLERVKRMLGLRGPAMAMSSACASSAAAITRAASMVRHGDAADVLVVSCDVVSEFVYSGFSTLMSLVFRSGSSVRCRAKRVDAG